MPGWWTGVATRMIPLTPYLAQQFAILPRVNKFVFASTGKAGRIADTRPSHAKALQSAGIDRLTIHGLSVRSRCWASLPGCLPVRLRK